MYNVPADVIIYREYKIYKHNRIYNYMYPTLFYNVVTTWPPRRFAAEYKTPAIIICGIYFPYSLGLHNIKYRIYAYVYDRHTYYGATRNTGGFITATRGREARIRIPPIVEFNPPRHRYYIMLCLWLKSITEKNFRCSKKNDPRHLPLILFQRVCIGVLRFFKSLGYKVVHSLTHAFGYRNNNTFFLSTLLFIKN